MIQIKQLHKTYEVDTRCLLALQDINLTIHHGEIFGIFGESGAGKSTLLRSLNLLEIPDRGQILINDIDLTTLSPTQLKQQRRNIGMIFQQFNLLQSRNVYKNIALPLELIGTPKDKIKQEVSSLLNLVQLTDHENHYPHQLSGGQQQRVAIARALATKPQILLCDEATSALDPLSTASILNLLQDINRMLSVTIILITHELKVIKKICQRAAVLSQGMLVEYGSVNELFTNPNSEITRQLVQKALQEE